MQIQYISDLHLEFLLEKDIIEIISLMESSSDVIVISGDIGNPYHISYYRFLSEISNKFKKIFIIAGNHEYYGNNIEDTIKKIHKIVEIFPNITFLDNSFEDYDGLRWIGSTLWTHVENDKCPINDIRMIKSFDINKYNTLHRESKAFIEDILRKSDDGLTQCIILTHHLPLYELILEKYRSSLYNEWFSGNLKDIISERNPIIKAWFYGHTHTGSIQKHHDIFFYCNPLGYKEENNKINFEAYIVI